MTAALLPIGKYEFRDVDYRQILIWAQALELAPMEIVQRIEDSYSDTHKALPHMTAQKFIVMTALAPRPTEPSVEAASRDIERLAHQRNRPGSSMLRQKAEFHIDSFAK